MGVTANTGPFNAAAEVFGVDDFVTNKFPRLKYNFSLEFILNENVSAPRVKKNFVFNRVVSVGLPDVDYGMQTLNQYNRLRHVPTRLSVGTVPIVFYDTKDNEFQDMMLAYAGHYFHGHNINPSNFNGYEVIEELFGSGQAHIFGAKSIPKNSRFFFEQINVNSRDSAQGGRSIQLFNCMITAIQHDTLAYSDSQPVMYSVTFQPEHFNIAAETGSESTQVDPDGTRALNIMNQTAINTPAVGQAPVGTQPYTGTVGVNQSLNDTNGELTVVPNQDGPHP